MRLLLRIVLTVLLAWLGMLFLPIAGLWATAIAAFIVGIALHKHTRTSRYRKPKPYYHFSFWGAFVAIFMLWIVWAFWIDTANDSVLSMRAVALMKLPIQSSWFVIFLSGLIAAIVGGLAGLAGNWLSAAVRG